MAHGNFHEAPPSGIYIYIYIYLYVFVSLVDPLANIKGGKGDDLFFIMIISIALTVSKNIYFLLNLKAKKKKKKNK
jgi:hypothetical protein